MICKCPIHKVEYERLNSNNYHIDDCPRCKQETAVISMARLMGFVNKRKILDILKKYNFESKTKLIKEIKRA